MNTVPLLAVNHLNVRYGPVQAVRDLNLRIEAGTIVALIGANGAGKTSTLSALTGLVRPTSGAIVFDGAPVSRLRPSDLMDRGIVHVPEGRAILHQMTVRENLTLGAFRRRDSTSQINREIASVCARFPILGERQRELAGSLSGGEQQMLAIARGLLARPKLLLLDEPSMGLAPKIVQAIFRLITEIRAEGVTVLLVEQNARRALAIADYGYVLESGSLVLEGPATTLAADQRVQAAYLGVPTT